MTGPQPSLKNQSVKKKQDIHNIQFNRMNIIFNYPEITADFKIFLVSYCEDFSEKVSFGKIINKIYQALSPLSLVKSQQREFYVLLACANKAVMEDAAYTMREIDPQNIHDLFLARLLIGALPSISSHAHRSCEKMGLFYLNKIERIHDIDVLRTLKVDITQDRAPYEGLILNLKGVTFTPLDYHYYKGKINKRCARLPRFRFDEFSLMMKKSADGEYIQKGHKTHKMKSPMISLSTKDPEIFWQTKMGVMTLFMRDISQYMGEYLTLSFKKMPGDYRFFFSDSQLKKQYQQIDQILKKLPIHLINLSGKDISLLIVALKEEGFIVSESLEPASSKGNIAIHHDKDFYRQQSTEDPYLKLHKKGMILQSIIYDSLLAPQKLLKEVYEACKKELLIKYEVQNHQLLHVIPNGSWRCIGVEKVKRKLEPQDPYSKEIEIVLYHQMDVINGQLSYSLLSEDEAEDLLLDLPELSIKYWQYAMIDLKTGSPFIFEETDYVGLPEFEKVGQIMQEITQSLDAGVPREWFEEFLVHLDTVSEAYTDPQKLKKTIKDFLLSHHSVFYREDFLKKSKRIFPFRGDSGRFLHWLHQEKGARLYATLRSRTAEDPLMHGADGFFFNNHEKLYYIAPSSTLKETVEHYCVMRRIVTDADEVPETLLNMMATFHVRHKQGTVYPFLFKHLREYMEKHNNHSRSFS